MEIKNKEVKAFLKGRKFFEVPIEERNSVEGKKAIAKLMEELASDVFNAKTLFVRAKTDGIVHGETEGAEVFFGNYNGEFDDFLDLYEEVLGRVSAYLSPTVVASIAAAQKQGSGGDSGSGSGGKEKDSNFSHAIARALAEAIADIPEAYRNQVLDTMRRSLDSKGIGLEFGTRKSSPQKGSSDDDLIDELLK